MENVSLIERLEQADASEAGEAFNAFMHTAARTAFTTVLLEEVETLCGKAYHPSPDSECKRAGSAPGRYFFGTQEFAISRPRVRCHQERQSQEVSLRSYQAGGHREALHKAMLRAFMSGVSSREQKHLFKAVSGTSPSEVSRLWEREGLRCIAQLRERDLGKEDYVVLMLDGIGLENDLCAIVALGITVKGEKHILDFQIGSSENLEVCTDLLVRIVERGFEPKRCLLVITDGSKALRTGVRKQWPDAIIQRCLIHKARNLKGYLSGRYHGEIDRLFARLRQAEGLESAEECLEDLRRFLRGKNAQALASLEEAGEELLAVQRLEAPSTLNTTLLNTNCIENPFRNVRAKTRRVTRWRVETDMASKWLAYALLEAERGFRKIHHYEDMAQLAQILEKLSAPPPEEGQKKAELSSDLDPEASAEYKP